MCFGQILFLFFFILSHMHSPSFMLPFPLAVISAISWSSAGLIEPIALLHTCIVSLSSLCCLFKYVFSPCLSSCHAAVIRALHRPFTTQSSQTLPTHLFISLCKSSTTITTNVWTPCGGIYSAPAQGRCPRLQCRPVESKRQTLKTLSSHIALSNLQ